MAKTKPFDENIGQYEEWLNRYVNLGLFYVIMIIIHNVLNGNKFK